ncbi:MAG: AAA family ATPase [Verrucomicrobiia bacterium]
MPDASPLNTLLTEFLPAADREAVEREAAKIEALPVAQALDALKTPCPENDPSELIRHRFLYRGGVCLLLGPTGIGKSSLLMQLAIYFALGQPLFGITPGTAYRERGMRIMLVQAENDEGDLAEMRDGVLAGCELPDAEKAAAQSRIMVCTVNDRSGEKFALTIDALLTEHGPLDLVIADPALAYLGGDSNSQKDVSRFMRELLNPLLHRHQVGLILAHHTNKPLRGKEKEHWEAGDYAYLGTGSAEWINPARAALALRSIGSDTVFELRAPKRGKRLRWEDENGSPSVTQFIAHHRDVGVICWREADPAEVEELLAENQPGRPRRLDPIEVLHCIKAREGQSQRTYRAVICEALGSSESAIHNAITFGVSKGWIRFSIKGKQKLYTLTEKGNSTVRNRPTTTDWFSYWSEIPLDNI